MLTNIKKMKIGVSFFAVVALVIVAVNDTRVTCCLLALISVFVGVLRYEMYRRGKVGGLIDVGLAVTSPLLAAGVVATKDVRFGVPLVACVSIALIRLNGQQKRLAEQSADGADSQDPS